MPKLEELEGILPEVVNGNQTAAEVSFSSMDIKYP